MTRGRAALLLGGMFVLGLACGALGTAAFTLHRMRHGGFSHERMELFVVRRLTRRLDLDATQRKTLEEIVHKTRVRLDQVHDEVAPKIEAILDDACEELRPSLNPDQQQKLEVVRAEAKERMRRHALRDP
jgi:hypothetical protein